MAADTKYESYLEKGLLPVATDEKRGLTISTPSKEPIKKTMIGPRRVLIAFVVCGLMTFSLASVLGHRGTPCARGQKSQALITEDDLKDPAKVDLLHQLLHAYYPDRYQDGVYPSDKEAIQAIGTDDADLASALLQLVKRQDNTTASASQPFQTSSATIATTPTSESLANTPTTTTPQETTSASQPETTTTLPAQTSTTEQQPTTQEQPTTSQITEQPQQTTPTTPTTSAAPDSGTSQTEQAASSSTAGPPSASSETQTTTRGSPTSSPPLSTTPSAPTTAFPGSSSASASGMSTSSPETTTAVTSLFPTSSSSPVSSSSESERTTRQSTTATSSRRTTTSFSEIRSTVTSTASNGDVVLITATSFVAVPPDAEPTSTSGSGSGGGLQSGAVPIGSVNFGLPVALAGFVAGAMLLL